YTYRTVSEQGVVISQKPFGSFGSKALGCHRSAKHDNSLVKSSNVRQGRKSALAAPFESCRKLFRKVNGSFSRRCKSHSTGKVVTSANTARGVAGIVDSQSFSFLAERQPYISIRRQKCTEREMSESGSLVSSTRKHRRPQDRKCEHGNSEDERDYTHP